MVRAVCFNPAKRPLLEKYQKGRTAVRLHNITSSIKDDIESIIMVVPFVYQDAATSSSLPSLSSLQEVAKEQLVDVKAEQFLFKENPSFTQDLAQVTTEIESLTQRKVSGEIIGVQHASKSLSCMSCKKKVTVKSNGKIANCQSCKMMMRVTSCQPQWFLKVLFQNTQNINDKLALTLFHHEVDKLASFYPMLTPTLYQRKTSFSIS